MDVTYRLVGAGWAEATLADGVTTTTLRASYLNDALRLLLDAVDRLLQGAEESRFSWADELGEYRWILERAGEQARLRVLGFHDIESPEPDENGVLLFDTAAPTRALAGAIVQGAQAVLAEYGEDGYSEAWGEPFPRVALTALRARLDG